MINRKYRIWQDLNKRLVYPDEITFHKEKDCVLYSLKWKPSGIVGQMLYPDFNECKIEHVMESTGLKDSEDNDIYEGDILKADDCHDIEVKYGEYEFDDNLSNCFGFYFKIDQTEEDCELFEPISKDTIENGGYVVSGNIYEGVK